MIRILILIFLLNVSFDSISGELKGTVCLGEILSIVAADHSDRLYITIGDSPKIHFSRATDFPRVVVQDLDLSNPHEVKIYFDEQVVESWRLNFALIGTDSVLVWRGKGSWRMEPIKLDQCYQSHVSGD